MGNALIYKLALLFNIPRGVPDSNVYKLDKYSMFHYASITVNNSGKACQEAQSCPLGPLLCATKHVTSRDMMNTPT